MRVALVAVGQRMPGWVREACEDYAARLKGRLTLQIIEVAAGRRSSGDVSRAMAEEARGLLAQVQREDHVVLLDERGVQRNSLAQAQWLAKRLNAGSDLKFLVGGPDGFHDSVRERAQELWSLSALTLPHALVRVVWIEQMYRAVTVLDNHPYHRE